MDLYVVEYTEDGSLKRCFEGTVYDVIELHQATSLCDEQNILFPECNYRVVKLIPEYKLQELQAQIDRLMLEFCPEDMAEEQMRVWGECQRAENQQPSKEKL